MYPPPAQDVGAYPPPAPAGPYSGGPYGYPPPAAGYGGAPAGGPPTYAPGPAYSGYPPPSNYPPPGQPMPPAMGLAGVNAGGAGYAMHTQAPPPKPAGGPAYDEEAAQAANFAAVFVDKQVRSAFVRKVMILVFLELAVTVGIAAAFMFSVPLNEYVAGPKICRTTVAGEETCSRGKAEGIWVFYVSWVLTLVMLIGLMCCQSIRRKYPYNYLAMFAFTCVMSVQVGCIVAYWEASVVLIAASTTAAATLGITLAAIFLPFDMTKRGNVLAMVGMVVFFISLMTIFIGFFYVSKWLYLAISCIFALLFCAYLLYDIQMVLGHKKYSISPDEYVFAAVQIYLDIVYLFLNLLQIIGIASR